MFYILLLIISLINYTNTIDENTKLLAVKSLRRRSYPALVFSGEIQRLDADAKSSCQWLGRLKHQSKLCWKRRGLAEALITARNLAVQQCQEKFLYDQWNCTGRDPFFKKAYRETAFMYSISSSAIVFAVARACSEGTLAGCKCGDPGAVNNSSEWHWGGCGDNSKYARKFAMRFLQVRKRNRDQENTILNMDAEVGIRVAIDSEEVICRCHGVSGSCSVKVCWKRLRSFNIIADQLKNLYHKAIQVEAKNVLKTTPKNRKRHRLLYIDSSPHFCQFTSGRRCKDLDNCATLCCGRGSYTDIIQVVEKCNCTWRDRISYKVQCQRCIRNETIYICK